MKRDFQRTIAIVNNKGGVGKTTSALNIAAGLAMRGRKVLIIDIDPQANASLALLGPGVLNLPTSIYDVLLEEDKPLRDILTPTPIKGLDLAPSHPNLANAEVNLTAVLGREKVLKRSMDRGLEAYTYIFIDCPPSLGLLTVNALLTGILQLLVSLLLSSMVGRDSRTRFLRISAPILGALSFRQLSGRMSSWTKPSLTINLFLTMPPSRRGP